MADVVRIVVAQATENLTENVVNGTTKAKSTPEGMAMAYGSLTIMALLPIVFGSYRSVNYHKENVCIQSASANRTVLRTQNPSMKAFIKHDLRFRVQKR